MLSVKNIAIGIKSSAVVVFDINELKNAEVIDNENKTPLAVFGKSVNNLFETYLCNSIFELQLQS